MHKLYLKIQHMHFGFMNVILLHSDRRHLSGYSCCRLVSNDISVPILLLTKLVHIPPRVPSMYITHRQQFLSSNILYLSLFYLLTGFVTRTIWFWTVEWSWHTINMFILLFLPPWRWPHEKPKHVCGHCVVKLRP